MRKSKKCKGGKTRMLSINPKCMSKKSIYASRKVQKRLRQLEKSRSLVKRNKSSKRRRRSKGYGRVVKDGGIDDEVDDEIDDEIKALEKQLKDLREKKRKRKQEEVEEEEREEAENKKAKRDNDDTSEAFYKLYGEMHKRDLSKEDDHILKKLNNKGQTFLHYLAVSRNHSKSNAINMGLWSRIIKDAIKYFIENICFERSKCESIMNEEIDGETLLSLLIRRIQDTYDHVSEFETIVFLLKSYMINSTTVKHAYRVINEEKESVKGNDHYGKTHKSKVLSALDKLDTVLKDYLIRRNKRYQNMRILNIPMIPFVEQEDK